MQEVARRGLSLGSALLLKEVRARELWPAYASRLKYSEDQPREPAGSPEGGQFAGGGGGESKLDTRIAGPGEERLRIPVKPGVKSKPCSGFGQCTQNALAEFHKTQAAVYVGTAVRKDRYAEALTAQERDGTHLATEAFPHAWNVQHGMIIDHTLGSEYANEHLYFGFHVPDSVASIVTGDELAIWHSNYRQPKSYKAPADISNNPDDLPALVRLSERLTPAMRRRFLEAIQAIKDKMDLDQLAEAITSNSVTRAMAAAKVAEFPERFGDLSLDLAAAFSVGARYSLEQLAASEIQGSFNLIEPHAVEYAKTTLSQIVQPYQDGAKELIQIEVTRAMQGEQTAMEVARNIRDRIGLDGTITKNPDGTYTGTGRVWRVNLEYERLLEAGVPEKDIDRRIGKFMERLSTERAELIARTEIHRAAGQGQLDSWREAVKAGTLNPDEWQRVWHAVMPDDGRTCDECQAMDGVAVEGFEGSFTVNSEGEAVDNGFGETMDFADLHVGCRCVIRLEKL